MIRDRCDICGGRGKICLPVLTPLSVRYDHAHEIKAIDESSSREYPCPECSPRVAEDHVAILAVNGEFHVYDNNGSQSDINGEVERATQKQCARQIAHELLDNGYIAFETGPFDKYRMWKPMRATLGVVSKAAVASIEERVAIHRQIIAEQVVEAAEQKINNWGSHFTGSGGPISKDMACRFVREALQQVLTRKSGA
jgi:hypothetical protein